MAEFLPMLPDDFEQTRATLHAYAHAVSAIPRVHAVAHPKWWHVALRVTPRGLVSENVPLPGGGILNLRMDLHAHEVVVSVSDGTETRVPMTDGLTGTELGDRLIDIAAGCGLTGEYGRVEFEDDDPREYRPEAAAAFFRAAANISHVFDHHLRALEGEVSRVQLWPHNFDLACEWFGTRIEGGEHPSQINLGFYPAGRAYFYSNPWPFDGNALMSHGLPHGAEWHTEGWEGSILYYDVLAGDPDAATKLLEYARAVFDIASPTLIV